MRLLHTADLHLREDRPETLEAFARVLEEAASAGVEIVTVGGDVFDSPADATRLRTDVMELCSGNPFDIVAIPGNHDEQILDRPYDLGTDLTVLRRGPVETSVHGETTIVGVPFQEELTAELYGALEAARPEDGVGVLLMHCTLDIGFDTGQMGEEATRRYLPVDPATLGELGYPFVLAGHFHSYDARVLPGGGVFVYPGAPVSHARGEEGRRYAVLVDTATGAHDPIHLDTHYYDSVSFSVTPGNQAAIPERIEAWVGERRGDDADLTIEVSGYVDADEPAYNDRLRAAAGPVDPALDVASISHVLDHELYRRFHAALEEAHLDDELATREGTLEVVQNALAELIDTGAVRR